MTANGAQAPGAQMPVKIMLKLQWLKAMKWFGVR